MIYAQLAPERVERARRPWHVGDGEVEQPRGEHRAARRRRGGPVARARPARSAHGRRRTAGRPCGAGSPRARGKSARRDSGSSTGSVTNSDETRLPSSWPNPARALLPRPRGGAAPQDRPPGRRRPGADRARRARAAAPALGGRAPGICHAPVQRHRDQRAGPAAGALRARPRAPHDHPARAAGRRARRRRGDHLLRGRSVPVRQRRPRPRARRRRAGRRHGGGARCARGARSVSKRRCGRSAPSPR